MGKGGQQNASSATTAVSTTTTAKPSISSSSSSSTKTSISSSNSKNVNASSCLPVWESPYRPLDEDSTKKLPTKSEIRAVIPPECFVRSYMWSMFYLLRDIATASLCVHVTSIFLTTDIPNIRIVQDMNNNHDIVLMLQDIGYALGWYIGWCIYGILMGTIMTGLWVIAHECGHGAFSDSQTLNDLVGYIVHQFLLVPYFAWQYTHAKHHRRTNHIMDGESHVPTSKKEIGLGKKEHHDGNNNTHNICGHPDYNDRITDNAIFHDILGDDAFAAFRIFTHLVIGWPIYLSGFASTGKLRHDGTLLEENNEIADHFRPNSPMFPSKMYTKVLVSTITLVATLIGLVYAQFQFGFVPVILWYWNPYLVVNGWLVLYTWLQHTDSTVPHYDDKEWTWVRGALSTIDRPYGIADYFHHTIGSTHVVHHLFHEMPWYNADVATKHVREYLVPQGLYNYDPTPIHIAMWRAAKTCHYIESNQGIQYFKSLENIPRTSELKNNNNNMNKTKKLD